MRQAGQLQFGFFHSLGIFLLKKDTDSKEQQPDIHAQGIIVNVNKVIFYLILRPGAVLPVNLSIACKTSFYPQPLLKFRNDLRISLNEFPSFRPGSYYGHFSGQHIKKLGQLVQMKIPQDLSSVLKTAEKAGCIWLCLDCDGEKIKNLPTYEW